MIAVANVTGSIDFDHEAISNLKLEVESSETWLKDGHDASAEIDEMDYEPEDV